MTYTTESLGTPLPDAPPWPPPARKSSLLSDLRVLRGCLLAADVKPSRFALPVLLALGVGVCEATGVALLVPLTRGVVNADFTFLHDVPTVRKLFSATGAEVSTGAMFAGLILTIFFVFFAKNAMQYGSSVTVALIVRRFANNMRKLLFSRCLAFGKLYFDRNSNGNIHSVLITLTDRLSARLSDLHQFFACLFTSAAYLVIMLTISVKLTLVVLLLFPVMHFSFDWLMHQLRQSSQAFAGSQGDLGKKIFNSLTCRPLVKSYAMEPAELASMSSISDRVEAFEFSIDRRVLLLLPIQDIIVMALILLLISLMALVVQAEGSGRIPNFLIFFYVLRRAAVSFGSLTNMTASLASISGPLDAVVALLDDSDKNFVQEGDAEFDGLRSEIRFAALDFSYAVDKPVLRGASFVIEKGKTTAIVGPSGAGKSTLVSLLARFYDSPPGTILIDGRDIRSFTLKSLAPHFALVSQDTLLFDDTLRANIVYGLDIRVDSSRLTSVLHRARIADLCAKLPAGLDTPIGERGGQLSGGEKQRVSIARAMMKDAEILILDEATSSLDSSTESLIQEAINEMIIGKTAVVIAHRLSTIKKADKIIVIDGGKVVEEGSLQELLAKKGLFHRLWESQRFD